MTDCKESEDKEPFTCLFLDEKMVVSEPVQNLEFKVLKAQHIKTDLIKNVRFDKDNGGF